LDFNGDVMENPVNGKWFSADESLFCTHINIFMSKLMDYEMKGEEGYLVEDFALPKERWYARAASLSLQRDMHNEGRGYICLNLLHRDYMLNASAAFAYGNKRTLLETLADYAVVEKMLDGARKLDGALKNYEDDYNL